ncbi:hypothetical protein Bmyc01_33270 [Bacillus mycoides]|nr:hypothetical protein Bmyc01_33270 [Bacillus mycoides]
MFKSRVPLRKSNIPNMKMYNFHVFGYFYLSFVYDVTLLKKIPNPAKKNPKHNKLPGVPQVI